MCEVKALKLRTSRFFCWLTDLQLDVCHAGCVMHYMLLHNCLKHYAGEHRRGQAYDWPMICCESVNDKWRGTPQPIRFQLEPVPLSSCSGLTSWAPHLLLGQERPPQAAAITPPFRLDVPLLLLTVQLTGFDLTPVWEVSCMDHVTVADQSHMCEGEKHLHTPLSSPLKWLVSISTRLMTPGCPSRKTAHSLPGTSRAPVSLVWKGSHDMSLSKGKAWRKQRQAELIIQAFLKDSDPAFVLIQSAHPSTKPHWRFKADKADVCSWSQAD